jgi:hypothetical protein
MHVLEHVGLSVYEHLVDPGVVEGPRPVDYGNQGGEGRQSGHHERAGLWWLVTHALWKRGIDYAVASLQGARQVRHRQRATPARPTWCAK